jgi:hypothetical protein
MFTDLFTDSYGQTLAENYTIKPPKKIEKYLGKVRGVMATGPRVPIDTEMDIAQRDCNFNDVWKYIEKSRGLDWNLFGYVTVVKFPDGTQKMINGLHRKTLVEYVAPYVTEVPAHIIDLSHLTQEEAQVEAAKYFAKYNGAASRTVSSEQRFWAEVIGLDEDALRLKDILIKANLSCGKVNDIPGTKKVKYNNFVQAVKLGTNETIRAAQLIHLAYPGNTINDTLLSGMARLFSHSSYYELMDDTTKIYEQFEDWFVNFLPKMKGIRDLSYRQYRNAHKWHDGVAYGLYRDFAHFQRTQGRWCIPVDSIKKHYEKGIQLDSMLDD